MKKTPFISHSRDEETMEAKARWFQSLTVEERLQMLCDLTDLALSLTPSLAEQKHAEPIPGRVQVLTRT